MTRLTSSIRSRQRWLKTDFSALVAADVPSALQGLVPAARSGGEPGPQTSRTDPGNDDDDDEAGTERVKKFANVAKQPAAPRQLQPAGEPTKTTFTHGGGGDILMQERFNVHPRAATPHACTRARTRLLAGGWSSGATFSPLWGIHLEWLLVAGCIPSPAWIDGMYNAG